MNAHPQDLFAPQPLTVFDDAEGGMRYWPGVVDPATAARWFDTLREQVDWKHERRPMYERIVQVPRLRAGYRLDALPAQLPLAQMLAVVQGRVPAPYTEVGLNFYRDGRDSVAMHHDKLHMLVPGQPIALLSLGGPRRMRIRAMHTPRTWSLELAPGSLLMMSHASQRTHQHGIPKVAGPVAPRMSVVLRARPD
ncbi:alpha-ketoglutarate-dependent dioxygenase AlkB [Pseudoxanthomonas spadix]|uniref:alpha-ketoglutarate-dependent dioxygenase AlkB n=1 Tax=Pseudoxanthomonas spadix TaxID=415229 RepID=UPI000EFDE45E|nr:alpha-ketoglutarate-dependent dioxygenase AlkB [Pseudoxanthomonas spadix]MBP3973248.1 alpha-ketoglutarate-dependent dioxygenase AlkB [Pseudoxanthomonas spadix]RMW96500.1 alpha-ketoglutarate-dependent dioxygenase AlkB [Pseudoxanthomonas spadix]